MISSDGLWRIACGDVFFWVFQNDPQPPKYALELRDYVKYMFSYHIVCSNFQDEMMMMIIVIIIFSSHQMLEKEWRQDLSVISMHNLPSTK